jgi:rRNA maturation protein Nop10
MNGLNIDENVLRAMSAAQTVNQYSIPTMLVDLPSRGLLYPEGHPLKDKETVEIKYMTTKEEDILLNQSFIQNGVVLDKLLESVILDKRVKVDSILNCDKNALQIACRINAYGENYDFEYMCQNCGTKSQSSINLSTLKHYEVDFETIKENNGIVVTLPSSNTVIKAKVLTGLDENEMVKRIKQKQKHNLPEEQLIERYRQIITSVNDNNDPLFIAGFIKNMPLRDSKYFMKEYAKFLPGVDFTFEEECPKCNSVNKGGVPVGISFFYPEQ